MVNDLSLAELGSLTIIETYEFYDEPLLFAATNPLGHIFLVSLHEDTDESRTWLYVPMSQNRFNQVRSGGITLHDAIARAELGAVHLLSIAKSDKTPRLSKIRASEIPEDDLPDSTERLDLETKTLTSSEPDVLELAKQLDRDVFTCRCIYGDRRRNEAPVNDVASLMVDFQATINASAQFTTGKSTNRARIPARVTKPVQLSVIGLYGGSLGLVFQVNGSGDMVDRLFAEKTFDQVMKLLSSTPREADLLDVLQEMKGRTGSKYRGLLTTFSHGLKAVEFKWGSPFKDAEVAVSVAAPEALEAIRIIDKMEIEPPEEFEIVGKLVGVVLQSKTYEIIDVDDGQRYKGVVDDGAMPAIEHATMSNNYRVGLRESTEIDSQGEPKVKYRLLSLTSLEDQTSDDNLFGQND